ncbi:MAG: CDP-diacylglycerol--glycerol-3-phosphate 3-phosphatidyltransferase [Candidatus Scatovivens sp.]
MNLPNKLTVFRIILVPIMVIIPFLGISGQFLNVPIENWIIISIFIIASYTDHLDGKIARKNNIITTFGKFADPLADKILVLSAMLMLVEIQKLPAWIPIIILAREFVVSGYRLIAVEKGGNVIAANIWGKIKTVTQMIGVIIMFLDKFPYAKFIFATTNFENAMNSSVLTYMSTGEFVFNIISTVTITISVLATIFSGWSYIKEGKNLFKD